MCTAVTIGLNRADLAPVLNACPQPFAEAWRRLQRLKSCAQWRQKLINLGQAAAVYAAMSQDDVGQHVYQHMCANGEFSAAILQPPYV